MADRLFDRLEQEAFRAGIQARTQQSMTWFRNRVSNLRVSRVGLIAQGPERELIMHMEKCIIFNMTQK